MINNISSSSDTINSSVSKNNSLMLSYMTDDMLLSSDIINNST